MKPASPTETLPPLRQLQPVSTVLVVGFRPASTHAHRCMMESPALDIVQVRQTRPLRPSPPPAPPHTPLTSASVQGVGINICTSHLSGSYVKFQNHTLRQRGNAGHAHGAGAPCLVEDPGRSLGSGAGSQQTQLRRFAAWLLCHSWTQRPLRRSRCGSFGCGPPLARSRAAGAQHFSVPNAISSHMKRQYTTSANSMLQ